MEDIKLDEKETRRVDLNSSLKNTISHFEDLSNELIYEIFDFLDFCDVYDSFSDLNRRFKNLLNDSTYPIKINFTHISKLTFQYYYTNIIIPYQERIQSLHLMNPYLLSHIFSPISNDPQFTKSFSPLFPERRIFSPISTLLKFIRLESLIINTIFGDYVPKLLNHLHLLPNLYSLVIMRLDIYYGIRSGFYQQIFRLPKLKYCKISIIPSRKTTTLPFATNEFSPIEYLIIEDELHHTQINNLLSYVPQVRRFSCHSCNFDDELETDYLDKCILNHLTNVSLIIGNMIFDKFEILIKNFFCQIEVLHISMGVHEITNISANRWKQLILSYMPHLRIFDIMITYDSYEYTTSIEFIIWMNEFNSSFWVERKWFFEYQVYKRESNHDYPERFDFYSINPYRRRTYAFHDETLKERYSYSLKRTINSVHHVIINNRKEMDNSMNFFPNANQLTLNIYADENQTSLVTIISSIVDFKRLTELVLYYNDVSQIIELLQYTPNVHTLTISYDSSKNMHQRSGYVGAYQLVFQTNNIKKLTILSECTPETADYFLDLFSRLQYLVIEKPRYPYESGYISRCMSYGNLSSLRMKDSIMKYYYTIKVFSNEYKVDGNVSWCFERIPRNPLQGYLHFWC